MKIRTDAAASVSQMRTYSAEPRVLADCIEKRVSIETLPKCHRRRC